MDKVKHGYEQTIINMRTIIDLHPTLSQKDIAAKMNMDPAQLSRVLNLKRSIKFYDVLAFCEVVKLPLPVVMMYHDNRYRNKEYLTIGQELERIKKEIIKNSDDIKDVKNQLNTKME